MTAARLDTLLAAFESAMRLRDYDRAADYAKAADALAWSLVCRTAPLQERAETARILNLEAA